MFMNSLTKKENIRELEMNQKKVMQEDVAA